MSECSANPDISIHGKDCRFPDEKAQELWRAYYACISYTDAQVGRVLQELEEKGFADNTVIILWADHGWQLGEHNEWVK